MPKRPSNRTGHNGIQEFGKLARKTAKSEAYLLREALDDLLKNKEIINY